MAEDKTPSDHRLLSSQHIYSSVVKVALWDLKRGIFEDAKIGMIHHSEYVKHMGKTTTTYGRYEC